MEETERLSDSIKQLLGEGRDERLADLLEDAHQADVSRVIRELPPEDQVRVFRLLSPQHPGEGVAEHVADVVEELPKEQAEEILELMEEEKSEEVQELLEYKEGTAGRLMSPEFVAVREETTVAQAIEYIRKAATGEGAFYLYVVDDHDHLVGVVPLHRLLAADAATPVRAICTDEVESARVDTDQEEVARLVQHYNLIQIPVVDVNRRLLGTIGVDDVIDVIREEATEDIQHLGGVAGDETVLDPPRAVFVKRNLWRLINLGTAVLAASVIGL